MMALMVMKVKTISDDDLGGEDDGKYDDYDCMW